MSRGNARVERLGLAPVAAAPMEARPFLDLVAGVGVAGDRYAEGGGTWADWPDREVTLVEAETADDLGLDALLLRRNVVTRGADLGALEGRRFALGGALLEGVRPCDPCAHLESMVGKPGLKSRMAGRGGLRARVVAGGRVSVGDAIRVRDATPSPRERL